MKEPKLSDLEYNEQETLRIREAMKRNPNPKIKITINLDLELLTEVKRQAAELGAPYQTYLNKVLRDAIQDKKNQESRLDRLEREVEELKKKVSK